MPKPASTSYPSYFSRYIDQVPDDNLKAAFDNQQAAIDELVRSISEEKSAYAYAAGKWTLKEMLQHLIDAERIFSYRALSFARKETTNLPGFEENEYAENSNANARTWASLAEELQVVRRSTILLFESFSEDMLVVIGTSNDNKTSVESLGFTILGHFYHHNKVINERYM